MVLEEARDQTHQQWYKVGRGCQFFIAQGLSNNDYQAAIAGGISGAMHTHQLAELYGGNNLYFILIIAQKSCYHGLMGY